MKNVLEIFLELEDTEWPLDSIDHDRHIARAVVFDDDGYLYFVRCDRDDAFGKAAFLETSGGGMEEGESPEEAVIRELREELGAETEIICKIGIVSDYYNLVHRHNINNYFLCRALSFGKRHLMPDEIDDFHLTVRRMRIEEAIAWYRRYACTRIGRLIAARELPVVFKAAEILQIEKGREED